MHATFFLKQLSSGGPFVPEQEEQNPFFQVPLPLRLLRAWLPFRIGRPPTGTGRARKVPYSIAERRANFRNPSNWMNFEVALEMLRSGNYDGIGIVLDKQFGLVGYDADDCILDGVISEAARNHIKALNSYTEVSLSGTGIHVLAWGALPRHDRKVNGFEMYDDGRFFVVTGRHLLGTPVRIEHRPSQIEAVHRSIFGRVSDRDEVIRDSKSVTQFAPNTQLGEAGEKHNDIGVPQSDEEVLRLLRRDPVASKYYKYGAGEMNPSRADFALGCKLAFYTGGDLHQMERLFMQSALGRREKCQTMRGDDTYVLYTLKRCLSRQKIFYKRGFEARPRTTGKPVGRPLSSTTQSVVEARRWHPTLRASQIGRMLGLEAGTVRQVFHRYPTEAEISNSRMEAAPHTQGEGGSNESTAERASIQCGQVLERLANYSSWVKVSTLSRAIGWDRADVDRELQLLINLGQVDCDGRGRYRNRKHRDRKPRRLKPCRLKSIPKCRGADRERRRLTRCELLKRGWAPHQIDKYLSRVRRDYVERQQFNWWRRWRLTVRYYWVSRIKAVEREPGFEAERAIHLRRQPSTTRQSPSQWKTWTSQDSS